MVLPVVGDGSAFSGTHWSDAEPQGGALVILWSCYLGGAFNGYQNALPGTSEAEVIGN